MEQYAKTIKTTEGLRTVVKKLMEEDPSLIFLNSLLQAVVLVVYVEEMGGAESASSNIPILLSAILFLASSALLGRRVGYRLKNQEIEIDKLKRQLESDNITPTNGAKYF